MTTPLHPSSRTLRTMLAALAMSGAMLTLSGCPELDDGPDIASVSISPNTVKKSSTGMTDEFFTVVIQTSGFESTLTGATVSIQDIDPPLEAQPQEEPIINGDTITLNRIPKSWFSGLDVGEYAIEASVTSELTTLRRANVATITVTEN